MRDINPKADPNRSLTTGEWAMELGCNPETLRRAIRAGRLRAKLDPLSIGPTYRITVRAMNDYLRYRGRGMV